MMDMVERITPLSGDADQAPPPYCTASSPSPFAIKQPYSCTHRVLGDVLPQTNSIDLQVLIA